MKIILSKHEKECLEHCKKSAACSSCPALNNNILNCPFGNMYRSDLPRIAQYILEIAEIDKGGKNDCWRNV